MRKKNLFVSSSMLVAFFLWTIAVSFVDVKAIGPEGSVVGFSAINSFVHKLTGVHMSIYYVTDWLGLVPIFVAFGFALLGSFEWIKRKKLCMVDYSLFILGGFYTVVISVYLLFETVTINYRPVLIEGFLETSYPSSTTLLTATVMYTAAKQLKNRMKNTAFKKLIFLLITIFTLFMIVGRLVSGVHWFTDIVGSILISISLVKMYQYFVNLKQ